jgi:hypothetical protein
MLQHCQAQPAWQKPAKACAALHFVINTSAQVASIWADLVCLSAENCLKMVVMKSKC